MTENCVPDWEINIQIKFPSGVNWKVDSVLLQKIHKAQAALPWICW